MKHETMITGLPLGDGGEGPTGILAPTILAYREDDFIAAFLEDMRAPDWAERLVGRSVFEGVSGAPELAQPVHRVFHIVVVDARCIQPGVPRVDPAKVDSAGLVVRRVRAGGEDGWMRRNDLPLGWQGPPSGSFNDQTDYDPDAGLRRKRLEGRNAKLLARLDRLPGQGDMASEDELPLFPVPPDVMSNTGMTLFYGFLPVSSGEVEPEAETDPPFDLTDVAARLPGLLRHDRQGVNLPPVNRTLTRADMLRPEEHPEAGLRAGLRTLKSTLVWLSQETGAFNDGAAPAMQDALSGVGLQGVSPGNLWSLLERCYRAFILQGDDDPASVHMPDSWPAISSSRQGQIVSAGFAAMSVRWATVSPLAPQYPAIAIVYRLRCFMRFDDCPGCPPRIVWSRPSPDWTIRPWFNGGDGPPRQIEMPALSLDAIKNLKPNVAVKVPPELQQHMDRINMGDLLEGKHTKLNIDFGMICGFSIPIITICAFIILQIFLQLLNIIFFWLPYVRICIPFPIVTTEEEDG